MAEHNLEDRRFPDALLILGNLPLKALYLDRKERLC